MRPRMTRLEDHPALSDGAMKESPQLAQPVVNDLARHLDGAVGRRSTAISLGGLRTS